MRVPSLVRKPDWVLAGAVAAALALSASPSRATADFINVTDSADAYAESTAGNGTFNSLVVSPTDLVVRQFTGTVIDVPILKFNLASLPAGATITSASLSFQETSFTTNVGRRVDILAFASGGAPSLADATAAGPAIGTYDSTALGNGVQTVSLAVTTLRGLIGSGSLTLRLQGDTETVNTQFAGLAGSTSLGRQAPQLRIDFIPATVPEPAAFVQASLFLGLAGVYGWRRLPRRPA